MGLTPVQAKSGSRFLPPLVGGRARAALRSALAEAQPVERAGLVIAWSLALAWIIASVFLPFGWDHGIIASVGDAILHGGLPYRDAWDMKGPLGPLGFALAELLFGRTMWGIRIVEAPLMLGAAVALTKGVSRLTTARVGAWAGPAFLLWYASHGWFFTAQPDGWVAAATAIAFAPLIARPGSPGCASLRGAAVAVGICTLLKPVYILLGLVPLLALALSNDSAPRRGKAAAGLLGLMALPVAVVLIWFAVGRGFAELVHVHLGFAATAYRTQQGGSLAGGLATLFRYFLGAPTEGTAWFKTPVCLLPALVLGAHRIRAQPKLTVLLAAWTTVVVAVILAQNRFYAYHMFLLFPPLLATGMMSLGGRSRVRAVAAAGVAVFLLANSVSPALDVLYAGHAVRHGPDWRRFTFDAYDVADQVDAARYIRSTTEPEDRVQVLGIDATVLYLSHRRTGSRFVFDLPLLIDSPFRGEYRAELMRDLETRPVEIIVVGTPWAGTKSDALTEFPEFAADLDRHYDLERRFGVLDLYRRKAS